MCAGEKPAARESPEEEEYKMLERTDSKWLRAQSEGTKTDSQSKEEGFILKRTMEPASSEKIGSKWVKIRTALEAERRVC